MNKQKLKRKLPRIFQYFAIIRSYWYEIRFNIMTVLFKEKGFEKLLKKDYKKFTDNNLSFPPKTYTEKIQWSKIYDSTSLKGKLSDKYAVRNWVKEKIGEEYLIPLIGVWESFDDIDFESLPSSFVLKTNHGSGTNLLVKDKNQLNLNVTKRLFDFWMKQNFAYFGCGYEMHYKYIKPKIIAEEYLKDLNEELSDYKFLCFNGQPYYCWVDVNRNSNHKRNVYDLEWNLQPWNQFNYGNTETDIPCPENFGNMIKLAQCLSEGFEHVRVDLYNVKGRIYFGEMTFTNGKGYEPIIPKEYDLMIGNLWTIQE